MMDNLFEEVAKGFLKGLGYIFAEIFFGTICYWVGWPLCKVITLGKYPASNDVVYFSDSANHHRHSFWCAAVGLLAILITVLYFMGQFL